MNKVLTTILTGMLILSLKGQTLEKKPNFFELGYNAIQESVQLPSETNRIRAYNEFTLNLPLDLEVKAKIMHEKGKDYVGGWNTLLINKTGSKVGLLYTIRNGGTNFDDNQINSEGMGLRASINEILPTDQIYGFVDAVVWNKQNNNASWLGKGELFIFAGAEYKGWNFETLNVIRPKGNNYNELEIFGPRIKTGMGTVGPFARSETIDYKLSESTVLAGIQFTCK